MNYLLTEAEYTKLKAEADRAKQLPPKAQLQELCRRIADITPIAWGWGGNDPKPWGCILTKKTDWYCDQCPVQDICPYEHKEWSK